MNMAPVSNKIEEARTKLVLKEYEILNVSDFLEKRFTGVKLSTVLAALFRPKQQISRETTMATMTHGILKSSKRFDELVCYNDRRLIVGFPTLFAEIQNCYQPCYGHGNGV